jgi:hypothetical protein
LRDSTKVYVIDPKTGRSRRGAVKRSERVEYSPEQTYESGPGQDGQDVGKAGRQGRATGGTRGRRKDSPALSLFSYFLGPMAVLATRHSGKSKIKIIIAAASGILSIAALWMWAAIFQGPATGSFVDGVWIFMGCIAVMTALTVWSASVALLGKERAAALRRLPGFLMRPFFTGLLGLIAPGLGLYVTGYNRRAAVALWMSGAAVLSVALLLNTRWLWQWNEATGASSIAPNTLEHIFIALGAMAVLGTLTWVVQVLDGTRLAGSGSRRAKAHGDLLAMILLGVIVIFAFTSQPAFFAQRLDEFAVSAYAEGFKIIPLQAVRGAAALDPSKPIYVMHAASIYEDLGMDAEARALHIMLWNRWEPCVDAFEAEGRFERHETPATNEAVFVEHMEAVPDQPVDVGSVPPAPVVVKTAETGRLTTWDRVDALCGSVLIEGLSASTGTP